jgi:hypothetical protein
MPPSSIWTEPTPGSANSNSDRQEGLGRTLTLLRGARDAFLRYPGSLGEARKKVLECTGIDIQSLLTPEQQEDCFTTLRAVFKRGLGYRSWERAWADLKKGCVKKDS